MAEIDLALVAGGEQVLVQEAVFRDVRFFIGEGEQGLHGLQVLAHGGDDTGVPRVVHADAGRPRIDHGGPVIGIWLEGLLLVVVQGFQGGLVQHGVDRDADLGFLFRFILTQRGDRSGLPPDIGRGAALDGGERDQVAKGQVGSDIALQRIDPASSPGLLLQGQQAVHGLVEPDLALLRQGLDAAGLRAGKVEGVLREAVHLMDRLGNRLLEQGLPDPLGEGRPCGGVVALFTADRPLRAPLAGQVELCDDLLAVRVGPHLHLPGGQVPGALHQRPGLSQYRGAGGQHRPRGPSPRLDREGARGKPGARLLARANLGRESTGSLIHRFAVGAAAGVTVEGHADQSILIDVAPRPRLRMDARGRRL